MTGPPHETVDALHEIALLIASETEFDRVLERVLTATHALLGARSASVFLNDALAPHGRLFTTIGGGKPHWMPQPEPIRPGGMTEAVLLDNVTVAISDVRAERRSRPTADASAGSILAAPLRVRDETIGVLYANFAESQQFGDAERHLIEMLGAYAATAVRNARLIEAERRAARRQAALLEMARAASTSLLFDEVFHAITTHTRSVLGADSVSVHRLNPDRSLVPVSSFPNLTDNERNPTPWVPDRFIEQALLSEAPVAKRRPADDPTTTPHFVDYLRGVNLAIAARLMVERECLGVIIAIWRDHHQTNDDELQLIEMIARQSSIALQNVRTHEAAVSAARLDGAVKTAQAAAHELSQPLSVVVGYGELLEVSQDVEQMRRFAALVGRAGRDAAQKLDQFRQVLRFVELRFGDLDPILDIERSSTPVESGVVDEPTSTGESPPQLGA